MPKSSQVFWASMAGTDGPLAAYGLVPDPELAKTQEMVKNRTPMGPMN